MQSRYGSPQSWRCSSCVTSVAEAKTSKRLALGQLDKVTAAWSITVTDCPYCLGGGQVDVTDSRGRRVDTYGHPLLAAGFLRLAGGRPNKLQDWAFGIPRALEHEFGDREGRRFWQGEGISGPIRGPE